MQAQPKKDLSHYKREVKRRLGGAFEALVRQGVAPIEPLVVQQTITENLPPTPNSKLIWPSEVNLLLRRAFITNMYITGEGIEVGALQLPVSIPEGAKVKYVDRLSVEQLRIQYPELNNDILVEPDVIDDGEKLTTFEDETLDFVIACHYIEHAQDPIGTIQNMLRVLKKDGILFLAIPDMEFTRDKNRPITNFEHLLRDHEEGPGWSRRMHFEEFVRTGRPGGPGISEEECERHVTRLMAMDYSIHYHSWTKFEMFDLFTSLKKKLNFPFNVEFFYNSGIEALFVLRKTDKVK